MPEMPDPNQLEKMNSRHSLVRIDCIKVIHFAGCRPGHHELGKYPIWFGNKATSALHSWEMQHMENHAKLCFFCGPLKGFAASTQGLRYRWNRSQI